MYNKMIGGKKVSGCLFFLLLAFLFAIWRIPILYRYPMSLIRPSKSTYELAIRDAAERNGVDPALLKAVVWQESGFDPNARGSKGEVGLMQIRPRNGAMEEWATAHHVTPPTIGQLFNPELNLEIGAWYLARALRKWKGYKCRNELALSEYNAGPTGMSPWVPKNRNDDVVDRITIASTRRYVRSIMERYSYYMTNRNARLNRRKRKEMKNE